MRMARPAVLQVRLLAEVNLARPKAKRRLRPRSKLQSKIDPVCRAYLPT